MKVGRLRGIWSLRPMAATIGLQLSCLLAAAVCALALATTAIAAPAARPPATALPENPQVLIAQRRCIDKVIGQARGLPEDVVVRQVNQQCLAQRPSKPMRAGVRLLSCERLFDVRWTPGAKLVTGCLSG
jgi:hypothetical protein